MEFADAIDFAQTVKYNMEILLGKPISLSKMTEMLTIFDVITKGSLTTEKQFMIDFMTIKYSYRKHKLSNVAFLCSLFNLAEQFTKNKPSILLTQVLFSGNVVHSIERWIIRGTLNDVSVDTGRKFS